MAFNSTSFAIITGRGLEKFLRRNSFSSDSSARECSTPITTKARNKTKSLESLTDKKDRESVKNLSDNFKSPVKKENEKLNLKKAEKPMESAKVIVKHTGEKLDKKKSQFNYESVIEITLPTLTPILPQVLDKSQNEEEPIKPILCTPAKPKIPSHNNANMSPSSVHESCVSNKQNPLEWDSFLPVSCLFSSVAINSWLLKCISLLGLRFIRHSTELSVMQSDGTR